MYAVPESDVPATVTVSSSDTEEYDEGKEIFNPPKAKKMTGTTSSTSDSPILKTSKAKSKRWIESSLRVSSSQQLFRRRFSNFFLAKSVFKNRFFQHL